jgi:hypothetical protein
MEGTAGTSLAIIPWLDNTGLVAELRCLSIRIDFQDQHPRYPQRPGRNACGSHGLRPWWLPQHLRLGYEICRDVSIDGSRNIKGIQAVGQG